MIFFVWGLSVFIWLELRYVAEFHTVSPVAWSVWDEYVFHVCTCTQTAQAARRGQCGAIAGQAPVIRGNIATCHNLPQLTLVGGSLRTMASWMKNRKDPQRKEVGRTAYAEMPIWFLQANLRYSRNIWKNIGSQYILPYFSFIVSSCFFHLSFASLRHSCHPWPPMATRGPGPPSRSSSKGPGSRRSSKGPGSRSSSKGPSRPISAIGSLALSSWSKNVEECRRSWNKLGGLRGSL